MTAYFREDDLLPLSALQHLVFCERRAALVLLEQCWDENRATTEGTILHQKIETGLTEFRGSVRIVRSLLLRSLRLGLSGKTDVVELHRIGDGKSSEVSVAIPGVDGRWIPFPIEYKRGRLREEEGYEVQLCAQAVCLEEMLGVSVPAGAVFYGASRRRHPVTFDDALRRRTEEVARHLHELFDDRQTPPARYEKKCTRCSLFHLCMPRIAGAGRSARAYLEEITR